MWAAISAVLQILYLIFKNKFERDAEERKRKEALSGEATTAIVNRDLSAINSVLGKLRQ